MDDRQMPNSPCVHLAAGGVSAIKPEGLVHLAAPSGQVASPASRGEAAGDGHRAPTQPEPPLACPLCRQAVRVCDLGGWEVLCECGLCFELPDERHADREATIAAWNRRPLQSQGREVPTGRDEWQAIETAPKDERVLLFVPAFGAWIASWWPGSWSCPRQEWVIHSPFGRGDKAIFGIDAPQPTHWMAMPAPPVSGGSSSMDAAPATGQSRTSEAPLADAQSGARPDAPETCELLRQAAEALEDAKELLLDYSPRSRTAKKCDLVAAALRQRAGRE